MQILTQEVWVGPETAFLTGDADAASPGTTLCIAML